MTTIAKAAFKNSSLTSVTIPDTVKTIEDEAFNASASLAEVHLGKGISSIGSLAFAATALTKLTILAPTSPSFTGSPAEAFPSSLTAITLNYPIGSTGYSEAPWSGFGTQKAVLDPAVIENVDPEHQSIIISLKALPGITITVAAYTEPGFTEPAAATADSDPTATAAQDITLTGLTNETPYYLRAKAYQDDPENPTDWIELSSNPSIPRPHPTVSIEGVSLDSANLTLILSIKALSGVTITASVHNQADYSDQAVASESLEASGEREEISFTGMTRGNPYYIRLQGLNSQGETSDWTEAPGNPYILPIARITDAIPRSGKITAMVEALEGTEAKIQASTNKDFTTITKELTFTGEGLGNEKALVIDGLIDDSTHYLRTLLSDDSAEYRYSTPLIPTADGTQHIHRLSELAKIGVDTENYPDNWNYELKTNLNFADADNDGVMDDPFDSDDDADNGNWTPLTPGTYDNDGNYVSGGYAGNFDGKKHSIEGMSITTPEANRVGFFNSMLAGGQIKDLGLLGGSVSGNASVGTLVGYSRGTISGSYATGDVSGQGQYVGGLLGYSTGSIAGSYATGDISGDQVVGGLVGDTRGPITGSYATGNVSGQGQNVGGLVGENNGGITDSHATGDVSGEETVGGLVGSNSRNITGSYATGNVSGQGQNVGGLLGYGGGGTITNSYATGSVTGTSALGGLVGQLWTDTNNPIRGSYATGSVTGTSALGGLVGSIFAGPITNSYATGDVSGEQVVGGLVGQQYSAHFITNSYATGAVSATIENIGRLLGGRQSQGTIRNSYYYDNQTITPPDNVTPNTEGSAVTLEQLKTSTWYTGTDMGNLGWSNDAWIIDGRVNGTTPFHPHIKNLPDQPDIPLPTL